MVDVNNTIFVNLQNGLVKKDVNVKPNLYSPVYTESGSVYTTSGDTIFNLPAVSASFETYYTFVKNTSGSVLINAQPNDRIREGGNGSTIYCTLSAENYANVTLLAAETTGLSGRWIITSSDGSWTVSG